MNFHLKNVFNDYGRLLTSKKSLSVMNKTDGWLCPEALNNVNYNDFIHNPKDEHYHGMIGLQEN